MRALITLVALTGTASAEPYDDALIPKPAAVRPVDARSTLADVERELGPPDHEAAYNFPTFEVGVDIVVGGRDLPS